MTDKILRLKNSVVKIDRCYNCPICQKYTHPGDIRVGLWFWCGVGISLPASTPLIDIERPSDCPLEDDIPEKLAAETQQAVLSGSSSSTRPEGYPLTPNLDIAVRHSEDILTINEFIECALGNGIRLAKYRSDRSIELVLLAEADVAVIVGKTLGIDNAAMQKEQNAVLKWAQEHP
jgi:hypothetical protein